ncbi:M56 family metallopeptidase [Streptomyces pinistramenti]|uniref:M56 family metallopeptidase n=1 Tax=Streptomyces pinistramenti TaxID=2884812 RepID=UPI001D0703CD|nr:M56 family metallopeptidase [Streptomyces pinistramenti]MCB5909114.1 M56 family metallopeptidase [Streptomyces pinistramenti]
MNDLVWVPLLVPFLAVPAARRLAQALPPTRAAWLLTGIAVGLAACSTAALALLVVPGASYVPALAALDALIEPLTAGPPAVTVALASAAAGLLAWSAAAVAGCLRRHRADLTRARALVGEAHGELAVLHDSRPDAYALPGRPGRIVVTTAMLRALEPAEREALFAHERAHLRGRHHLFLAAAELAARCHPALRPLREPLGYALERIADEAAAAAVGSRALAARAIGRAALAGGPSGLSRPLLAATAGPVPRRVAALLRRDLGRAAPAPRVRRFIAAGLLVCLVGSGACALSAADDLHAHIEVAQGEASHL